MKKFACIVLAAGLGRRFGGNKLSAMINGKELYRHCFDSIPQNLFEKIIVVSSKEEILSAAKEYKFASIYNPNPEIGISSSIKLGLSQAEGSDGALFMVADQPNLTSGTISTIISTANKHPDSLIVPCSEDGQEGNPCFFPSTFFSELIKLEGDTGGKRVVRSHSESIVHVLVDKSEFHDIDTINDLKREDS